MGNFSSGPAYGNWEGDPGHEGATKPMESLKGTHGRDWEAPPMESTAMGDSRHIADPGGPGWHDTFNAPQPAGTRGTTNYYK